MSREILDLVKTGMQASAKHPPDFEVLNQYFAEDHVFVPVVVWRAEARGGDGYTAWLDEKQETLP